MRISRLVLVSVAVATGGLASAQNPVDTLGSITANSGMYSNRIPVFSRATPYAEVCFKNGEQLADLHPAGGSTGGGNCEVGDTGWVIEADERLAAEWWDARAECLKNGMRLPEAFEFLYSCENADALQLNLMTATVEWGSNSVTVEKLVNDPNATAAPTFGRDGSCTEGGWSAVTRADGGTPTAQAYRCVK